jgi:nitrogenase-associated protein
MDELVFYEKPGCVGNQQQKAVLRGHGCRPIVRDLLREPWTAERLRPFFADKPVSEWFNLSAPAVKSGEIDIHALDEAGALRLMLKEPLLICRPLMQYGEIRQSGFLPGPVLTALQLELPVERDLQSCPMTETEAVCADPA